MGTCFWINTKTYLQSVYINDFKGNEKTKLKSVSGCQEMHCLTLRIAFLSNCITRINFQEGAVERKMHERKKEIAEREDADRIIFCTQPTLELQESETSWSLSAKLRL